MRAHGGSLAVLFAAAFIGGCAAMPEAPGAAGTGNASPAVRDGVPSLVRNGDFEAPALPGRACPPSWGCTMHADPRSFQFELVPDAARGGTYLKVTRVRPEPWVLVSQMLRAPLRAGQRLRVTANVNTESVEGGAGPKIILQGIGGRAMGDRKSLQSRRPGWTRVSVEIVVVEGTERAEIALTMEGGGWAGFDDVDVEVLPPR